MLECVSKSMLNKISYLHVDSLEPNNYGTEVQFNFLSDINNDRYYEGGDNHNYFKLEEKLIELFDFIVGKDEELLIFSYEDSDLWDINLYMKKHFKTGDIMDGIKTNEREIILKIFRGALKYQTFPIFINSQFAIIPTDHLDLFIYSSKDDMAELLERICQFELFVDNFTITK